jgi:iron complex transport system ATP-binding protein
MLETTDLVCGYGPHTVLAGISLRVAAGEMVALLGRNGSGKSTLLRCLAGALPPRSGAIVVDGRPLATLDRRGIARRIAVVPQELHVPFAFSAREVVELGRTPYARFMGLPTVQDREAVDVALQAADLRDLAETPFQHLSGGEQQRVALAMALAQESPILLLDEPTVHLDLAHQVAILNRVRRLCVERGLAVLAAMHDINLAALYFDRLIVLAGGTVLVDGTPDQVVTSDLIGHAFGAHVVVLPHPAAGVPQIAILP